MAQQMANDRCLCGGPVDADYSVQWKGNKIAFCSDECMDEWDGLTDQEKQSRVQELTEAQK